ncbi:MAG TPA: hypothetical protein VNS79_04315 [Sphingobium sp.]|nr:hypothetical protein [Sphingobium sp.]
MKLSTWMIGISAATLAFSAHAQDVPDPSSDAPVTQPAPPDAPPPAEGPADPQSGLPDAAIPPAAPAPPYDAGPPPPASTPQTATGAQDPVVQSAPAAPTDYPKCSSTVKDECVNPGRK